MPLERTATPVELDQVYGALDDLSVGARSQRREQERGALRPRRRRRGEPRRATARQLNQTLTGLLPGGRDAGRAPRRPVRLAGQPADFTSALATIDAQVGQFNDQPGRRRRAAGRRAPGPRAGDRAAVQGARRRRRLRPHNTHPADDQRQPPGRRHAGPGAAAARRWPQVLDVAPAALEQPRRTPTTPTTARSTPATTRSARPAPRSIVCQVLAAAGPGERRQPAGAEARASGRLRSDDAGVASAPGCSPATRTPTASPTTSTTTASPTCRSC